MPRSTRNDLTWTRWSFSAGHREKLAQIRDDFGFATSTDQDAVLNDSSVDLVDICLPTRLHADVAVRALNASKDVLIELPFGRHSRRRGAHRGRSAGLRTARVRGHVLPVQPR
jgi:hypothetical protein